MQKPKKFTLMIIAGIIFAIFIMPYLYHKFVYSPGHSTPISMPQ